MKAIVGIAIFSLHTISFGVYFEQKEEIKITSRPSHLEFINVIKTQENKVTTIRAGSPTRKLATNEEIVSEQDHPIFSAIYHGELDEIINVSKNNLQSVQESKISIGGNLLSPLLFAISRFHQQNSLDIIHTLLKMGHDINSVDSLNQNALFYALLYNVPDIFSLLITSKINVRIKNVMGDTALTLCNRKLQNLEKQVSLLTLINNNHNKSIMKNITEEIDTIDYRINFYNQLKLLLEKFMRSAIKC